MNLIIILAGMFVLLLLTLLLGVSPVALANLSASADIVLIALILVAIVVIGLIAVIKLLTQNEWGKAVLFSIMCFGLLFVVGTMLHAFGVNPAIVNLF